MKKFFYMAGLPRSGSTLLSAILNQNEELYCSTNSPILDFILNLEYHAKNNSEQFKSNYNEIRLNNVLSSIIKNYYFDISKKYIIDKSRAWPLHIDYIIKYIDKDPKIICTVRSISEILGSFIKLHLLNDNNISFIDRTLLEEKKEITNFNRCQILMRNDGIVGASLNALKKCYYSNFSKNLMFIEYNDLINNTENEIKKIYKFLNINEYSHDLNNIYNYEIEDDRVYGLSNMHKIHNKITIPESNNKYLSLDILTAYHNLEFWRKNQKYIFSL